MNAIAQKFSTSLLQSAYGRIVGLFEVAQREVAETEEYNQRVDDAKAELLQRVDSRKAKHLFYDI